MFVLLFCRYPAHSSVSKFTKSPDISFSKNLESPISYKVASLRQFEAYHPPNGLFKDGTLTRHKLAFVDQCTNLKCELAEKNVSKLICSDLPIDLETTVQNLWP